MRFSDFVRLGKEHIVEIDGNRWIELRTHKTGERVVIPIYLLFGGKAGDIIDEHGVKKLTRIGCNAETNKILHLLTTEAGISKLVTMHSARHTFATLLLHDGVPVTTVQKLLGHTSVKTTQIYAEVTTETIKKDLLKCMKSGQMRDVG